MIQQTFQLLSLWESFQSLIAAQSDIFTFWKQRYMFYKRGRFISGSYYFSSKSSAFKFTVLECQYRWIFEFAYIMYDAGSILNLDEPSHHSSSWNHICGSHIGGSIIVDSAQGHGHAAMQLINTSKVYVAQYEAHFLAVSFCLSSLPSMSAAWLTT